MKPTILLIEDNETNLYLATFLLEKGGYTVRAAPDGIRGIEMARQERPTAILLDIQLPTMDGYGVTRALRAIPSLEGVPIIAVTSYAMLGDREKAIAAGCTGYIEKPVDPVTFVLDVERIAGLPPALPPTPPEG